MVIKWLNNNHKPWIQTTSHVLCDKGSNHVTQFSPFQLVYGTSISTKFWLEFHLALHLSTSHINLAWLCRLSCCYTRGDAQPHRPHWKASGREVTSEQSTAVWLLIAEHLFVLWHGLYHTAGLVSATNWGFEHDTLAQALPVPQRLLEEDGGGPDLKWIAGHGASGCILCKYT